MLLIFYKLYLEPIAVNNLLEMRRDVENSISKLKLLDTLSHDQKILFVQFMTLIRIALIESMNIDATERDAGLLNKNTYLLEDEINQIQSKFAVNYNVEFVRSFISIFNFDKQFHFNSTEMIVSQSICLWMNSFLKSPNSNLFSQN